MKKLIIFILLVIIVLLFGFVYLKSSSIGPEDNYFNANLRHKVARSYFMRNVLKLNNDGDAKSDFIGNNKIEEILIDIDSMEGLYVSEDLLVNFAEKLGEITGKKVSYIYLGGKVPYSQEVKVEELKKNAETLRNHKKTKNRSILYLLVASQREGSPERLGSTFGNDGIILFQDALEKNMQMYELNDYKVFSEKLALGVLVHEFGHQIGLDHNDVEGCMMNEKTELSSYMRKKNIITEFCEFEKGEINKIKQQL